MIQNVDNFLFFLFMNKTILCKLYQRIFKLVFLDITLEYSFSASTGIRLLLCKSILNIERETE